MDGVRVSDARDHRPSGASASRAGEGRTGSSDPVAPGRHDGAAHSRRATVSGHGVAALACGVIAAVAAVAWTLRYVRYGFDFSDEGFHYVWMADPSSYPVSASQFGFMYHPLYELLGGSIAMLRGANVAMTVGLAVALVAAALHPTQVGRDLGLGARLSLAAAFGTSAMAVFPWAQLSPSYNTLNLQGAMVATIGVLLLARDGTRARVAGSLLAGIGAWAVFMARPTSAPLLAVALLVAVATLPGSRWREVAGATVTSAGLLVASALAIDGSVGAFVERIRTEIQLQAQLGAGHTLRQAIRVDTPEVGLAWAVAALAAACTLGAVAAMGAGSSRLLRGAVGMFCGCAALLAAASGIGAVAAVPGHRVPPPATLGALALALVPGGLFVGRSRLRAGLAPRRVALAGSIAVIPYCLAFGSNNNYWLMESKATVFWVVAALLLVVPVLGTRQVVGVLAVGGVGVAAAMATMLAMWREHPYRQQQPLRTNTSVVTMGTDGATVVLNDEYGSMARDVTSLARDAGMPDRAPMIDLTGRSPGIAFLLGARVLARPWLPGNHPGSEEFAIAYLQRARCDDVARAWVLAPPEGPGYLPSSVLDAVGIDADVGLAEAGAFSRPAIMGAGGSLSVRLLRPTRGEDEAREACVGESGGEGE